MFMRVCGDLIHRRVRDGQSCHCRGSWSAHTNSERELDMTIRTQVRAGKIVLNHNDAMLVRSAIKAGGVSLNHNEALQVRSAIRGGGENLNHSESLLSLIHI